MITIVCARGKVALLSDLPKKSIALDGYVQGPEIDMESLRLSFDHHDKCLRLVTKATCEQVGDALLLGLDPTGFTVYVNDVDGDTVLSVWLLRNHTRVNEFAVRELVATVGAIDAHGPAYPVINHRVAKAFYEGVMAPEKNVRRTKGYGACNLEHLLEKCVDNVDALLDGALVWEDIPASTRDYTITHRGSGWVMVASDDFIFDLLYREGYTRAIVYKTLPALTVNYTVGKKSELVDGFPVGPGSNPKSILFALNAREPGWGGGSTIGGSPRNADGSRSGLTPDEVFEIVEGVVANR